MVTLELIKELAVATPSRIVMLIMDGLGGLPHPTTGKTELESASTPNLDRLVRDGTCGLIDPVSPGITSGSGPGHLGLFGYDPTRFVIGRGVLEALGIEFELRDTDVAARGNFCTVDERGLIVDRRAGRISTGKARELCTKLGSIKVEGVQLFVLPVKEHRFVVVFRGEGLKPGVNDTDPEKVGVAPVPVIANDAASERMADIVRQFLEQADSLLAGQEPTNMLLMRGFSKLPKLPSMGEVYKLTPAAIVDYPMYKGVAKILGMKIVPTGGSIVEELSTLTASFGDFDFFFVHVKKTDSRGEDGDFPGKVRLIEEVDAALPELISLKPDVIVVTGDHSTPAIIGGHSWHPVPILLHSRWCRSDSIVKFSERGCLLGGLGRLSAVDVMPLAMANALKLTKYGA